MLWLAVGIVVDGRWRILFAPPGGGDHPSMFCRFVDCYGFVVVGGFGPFCGSSSGSSSLSAPSGGIPGVWPFCGHR